MEENNRPTDDDFLSPEDVEFVKQMYFTIMAETAGQRSGNLKVNPEQLATITRLAGMLKAHEASVQTLKIPEDLPNGSLTVTAPEITLEGEELQEFCELLRKCSAFFSCADLDENILLDFLVPDVHIPKD